MRSPNLLPISLCAVAALAAQGALSTTPSHARAEDVVAVRVHDGRILTGEVDARTDENLLWLRSTAPSIAITSSIGWGEVLGARHGDRELSAAEFRPLAEKLKSELPGDFFSSDAASWSAARHDNTREGGTGLPQKVRSPSRGGESHAGEHQKVRWLHVQAAVANWDADVEVDGLELRVAPYADGGHMVAADGMLSVRLIGQQLRATTRRDAFRELGRWSAKVRTTDYDTWGAIYRFPFRNIHPEFDLDFSADGLVHAKLGIPGQGNFEASVPVSLRSYNPLREQLQLREHKRFFPEERTGLRVR